MKKLELNQMEKLDGGKGGFGTSFVCAMGIIGAGALTIGTAGVGAAVAAGLGAMACGAALGHRLDTNNWW